MAAEQLHRLALAHMEDDDWSGAVPLLERARLFAPTSTALLSDLGVTHEELGETDAALACYRHAVALGSAEAGFLAALLHLRRRADLDAATDSLLRAIQRDPEYAHLAQDGPEFAILRKRPEVARAIRRAFREEAGH